MKDFNKIKCVKFRFYILFKEVEIMCRYCEKNELLLDGMEELIYIDNNKLNISNIVNNTINNSQKINYCPMCGRKLSNIKNNIINTCNN